MSAVSIKLRLGRQKRERGILGAVEYHRDHTKQSRKKADTLLRQWRRSLWSG